MFFLSWMLWWFTDTPNLPTSGLLNSLLPYATTVMVIVFVVGVGTWHSACNYSLRVDFDLPGCFNEHGAGKSNWEDRVHSSTSLPPAELSWLAITLCCLTLRFRQESCSMTVPAQHTGLDHSVLLCLRVRSVVLGTNWSVPSSSVQKTSGNKCWLCSGLYLLRLRCWRAQYTSAFQMKGQVNRLKYTATEYLCSDTMVLTMWFLLPMLATGPGNLREEHK